MTSTTSCYKLSQDVRRQLFSMRGIILLMTSFYMLIGPVAAYLSATYLLRGDVQTLAYFAGNSFLKSHYMPFYLVAIAFGAVGATYITRYQHVRKQSNFYHSLPVSRMQLLTSRMVALFIIQVVLLAVSLALIVVISGRIPIEGFMVRVAKWACIHFIHILLAFLLSFAIALLAGQLTANTISQLLMIGVLHCTIPLVGITAMAVLTGLFYTFDSEGIPMALMSFNIFRSMSFETSTGMDDINAGLLAFQSSQLVWPVLQYIIFIVLIVFCMALAFYLYQRRQTEKAGETLQYRKVGIFIKVIYIAMATTLVGLLFYEMGEKHLLGFLVGAVLAMIIVHLIIEMIYQQTIHVMRRHWISALVGLAFALVICGVCIGGILDYDHYLPKTERVSAVDVNFQLEDSPFEWSLDEKAAKDPAYIASVMEMVKQLSDKNIIDEERLNSMMEEDEGIKRLEDNNGIQYVQVVYKTKYGLPTVRHYNVSYDDFQKLYGLAMNYANYHESVWREELLSTSKSYEGITLDISPLYEEAMSTQSLVYLDAKGQQVNNDPKKTSALLAAMKSDIEKRNAETYQSGMIGSIYLEKSMSSKTFTVYAKDEALRQLFETWRDEGYLPSKEAISETVLIGNDVLLAELNDSERGYSEIKRITDKEEAIRYIFEDSVDENSAIMFGAPVDHKRCLVIQPKMPDAAEHFTIRYLRTSHSDENVAN